MINSIQPANMGKLKGAIMRAVDRIDDVSEDYKPRDRKILGEIANRLEEAALFLMEKDGASAVKELEAAVQLGAALEDGGKPVLAKVVVMLKG
jgi:predicted component of type VI protein secretion system